MREYKLPQASDWRNCEDRDLTGGNEENQNKG